MLNGWRDIVREQLRVLKTSGLYDECDGIYIGALGEGIRELEQMVADYDKITIVRYSSNVKNYEFWTLKIAWYYSQSENFYGVYIHTKGVSFQDHPGGKYWRDYMMHYNVREWMECRKQLRKGYDTCGVKLLDKSNSKWNTHYSGNFFWFKSSYAKRLNDPDTCNKTDRFQAEFWIGGENPKAATLCQDFVDYNTKGSFYNGKNYVHTLAFNLPSEVEKVTKNLYSQCAEFEHIIVDLGFPVEQPGVIPKSIAAAKRNNTEKLKQICEQYGSEYMVLPNIGVSQNWTAVWRELSMSDHDVLIGADPDEHTLNDGWVEAMGDVLRSGGIGLVSLLMTDHEPLIMDMNIKKIAGHNCLTTKRNLNWALIGMSGEFMKALGEVPYPPNAERYGWIEDMIRPLFKSKGYDWVMLRDYMVRHTDYSLGDAGTDSLLREWKNTIIFRLREVGQISFEEFLKRKKNGEF